MEFIPLDITVVSADGLKEVNMFTEMDVYVVVSISGDQTARKTTNVDKKSGKNPKWNHTLQFIVHHDSLPSRSLDFTLLSKRSLGDRIIGEVSVPIRELIDTTNKDQRTLEYQVRIPSGKSQGTLKFGYKFGAKFTQQVAPPPPPPQYGYGMPSQPQPYGYPPAGGYPPQQPQGYPQQAQSYPPYGGRFGQQMPKKRMGGGNKMGLGLGAGLLGGLLVGDMISDAGDMGGYDGGGFDGGGGMDFDF